MKKCLLLVLVLCSSVVFAREITLDNNVDLGELLQGPDSVAGEDFTLRRTINTPDKLKISFNYVVEARVCSEFLIKSVYIPGRITCRPLPKGGQVCTHTPGKWIKRKICIAWDITPKTVFDSVKLDFKRAIELSTHEEEIFSLHFNQKDLFEKGINIESTIVESAGKYKIKKSYKRFSKKLKKIKYIAD